MFIFYRRVARYGRYFGPGVDAEVLKVDAETRLVGIKLTTRYEQTDTYMYTHAFVHTQIHTHQHTCMYTRTYIYIHQGAHTHTTNIYLNV